MAEEVGNQPHATKVKCGDKEKKAAFTCHALVKAPRVGDLCPECQVGHLDYDGLLNLTCPVCGSTVNDGGAFT